MSKDEDGKARLDRLALLADAEAALASTLDLLDGLRRACRVLTGRLGDWCVVDLLDECGRLERAVVVHRTPEALVPGGYEGPLPPVPDDAGGPLPRVLRGAGPLLIADISPPSRAVNPLHARQLELFEQLAARSAVITPLRARREVLGALTVARTDPHHPFTDADLPLIEDLVRGLAVQVDNARLYQQTQRIAERFQRALLPELPHVQNLQIAARYASAQTVAQVGGDWYDAFVLPRGSTALVIGDVTGHDLQAAIDMSALRNMLRGIAVDRREPPGEVLRRLDIASHTLQHDATATCIYALVKHPPHHKGPWPLHHSCAGHLPPLLTTAEGDTRYLEAGAGLLIGLDPQHQRPTAIDHLPPHSTLLLYTDGLIERRSESLERGFARLRQHAAALSREPLETFCDELLGGLAADSTDDAALLALRPSPAPA
ncbi:MULTISPECIES: GAF domain-containing SpoIIE family protein phosphatase [unclassified Streptomyces]|uniref:PP2C family protein-serine/threonine phosphatase n=1 Tax=unclassified Streptomyces TaxID=2593676 RepID=UPI0033D292FC